MIVFLQLSQNQGADTRVQRMERLRNIVSSYRNSGKNKEKAILYEIG